jgi:hypothetical protein
MEDKDDDAARMHVQVVSTHYDRTKQSVLALLSKFLWTDTSSSSSHTHGHVHVDSHAKALPVARRNIEMKVLMRPEEDFINGTTQLQNQKHTRDNSVVETICII